MKTSFRKIIFSSWVWAIVPAMATGYLFVNPANRISVELTDLGHRADAQVAFVDLNGDGITEQVHGFSAKPLNNFPVMDNESNLYDQWNLPDDMAQGISELYFGDYDSDKAGEIYLFTIRRDSIFLNINEFFQPNGTHLERFFICKVNLVQGVIDSNIRFIGFLDTNGDGKDELYFRINSGFGLWPRHCYYFDIPGQKLYASDVSTVNFNFAFFEDLDRDGRPEIFGSTTASGNIEDSVSYTDYSAWLMVLGHKLEFKFKPVEFPGFGGAIEAVPLRAGTRKLIATCYTFQGAATPEHEPGIYIFSEHGKFLRKKSFRDLGVSGYVRVHTIRTDPHHRVLLIASGNLIMLDHHLNELKRIPVPVNHPHYYSYVTMDVDEDQKPEIWIFSQLQNRVIVLNQDLTTVLEFPVALAGEWKMFKRVKENNESDFFVQMGQKFLAIKFVRNELVYFSYLLYPVIYLSFVLFIMLVQHVSNEQIEKREAKKRQLLTLQLQSIKSQFDPHFTFNSLNSVASLLYLEDRKLAYDALNKFTRLLRQMLNDAERVDRQLEEEIEFVTSYLELEKVRFGNKLNFRIEKENVTGKERVPKLVLQTFAENAVKHGIVPSEKAGWLLIRITKKDDQLFIVVEDNGIGRRQAALNSNSGKGLKMTSEFYQLLNQLEDMSVSFVVTDLKDESSRPTGTRVNVTISHPH